VLNIPLPFLAGLAVVLVLHHSLKGVKAPRSRFYFIAFFAIYALQGLIVGLHFGYGLDGLGKLQPVTAALMPPMAYLAFRSLTAEPSVGLLRHLTGPVAVLATVLVAPVLLDPLLLALFVFYGLLLWRLTRSGGETMSEASLQRMRPVLQAARLTAALVLFFAAGDALLAVYTRLAGVEAVPFVVMLMNLVTMAAVLVFALLPRFQEKRLEEGLPSSAPADEAIVVRVTALLQMEGLYRDENLSLARLARKAGLQPRILSSAINRATGLNVSQFVNNFRVADACRLMAESNRSATAIMLEAGFSTKSNFNREFRRVTGQSPSEWRAARSAQAVPRKNGLDLSGSRQQLGNVQR
jgi:AraC-like DNA-binding protein